MNSTNQSQMYSTQPRITELESIRGLAALLVAFSHIPLWNPRFAFSVVQNGYLMVELFFVLSGFVIYNAYHNKILNCRQFLGFQFLRLGRLYPVHFLFLIFFLVIEASKYVALERYNLSLGTLPFERSNLNSFLQQLFLIQAIGPTENANNFNVPAWSISVEFYTYMIFALTLLYARGLKNTIFTALFIVSIAMLVSKETFGFPSLIRCTTGFFLGCMCAAIYQVKRFAMSPTISIISFLSVILFLLVKEIWEGDVFIYPLTALLIVTIVNTERGIFRVLLCSKALIWLGERSYSIYMSHYGILWVFDVFLRRALKYPIIQLNERPTVQLPLLEACVACLLAIGIVLIVSDVVYRVLEKPVREKSRHILLRTTLNPNQPDARWIS